MKPIRFSCEATTVVPPAEIAAQILDVSKWPSFPGYGPIPGIKSAEFEIRRPEVVGTRIRVTNTDGSSHVEEIVVWERDRICLVMQEFSAPLSRLSTRFVETWEFRPRENATAIRRSFELYPKSIFAWPFLWLISRLLRRAIVRHVRFVAGEV